MSSTTSCSVSPRTIWPHSHVICLAMVGCRADCLRGTFPYVASKVGAKLDSAAHTYVQLCGQLRRRAPRARDRAAAPEPPGPHGLRISACLQRTARRRPRRADRGDLGWGGAEGSCDGADRAAVEAARRRWCGCARRTRERSARPAAGARVDVEQALAAVHRAESAVVQQDWARAWSAALGAQYVAARRLLSRPGRPPWLDGWRRRLDDTLDARSRPMPRPAWGSAAPAAPGAERAARGSARAQPARAETGYGPLMQALAARGHVPEALHGATSTLGPCCVTSSASRRGLAHRQAVTYGDLLEEPGRWP